MSKDTTLAAPEVGLLQKTEDGEAFSPFADSIYKQKYAFKDENGQVIETWDDTAWRVTSNVLGALGYGPGDKAFEAVFKLILERKFMPGGRYLYASGRGLHQTQNCLLLRAEDSREGWADLTHKAAMALMTGAGIGIDYSDVREEGAIIKKTGGFASGPQSLMCIVNELGRNVMQGGSRRSAIWAGLRWSHPDIFKFIDSKNWSPEVRALKERDFNFPAQLDMTNISVILDREFFDAYDDVDGHYRHIYMPGSRGESELDAINMHEWAQKVYWATTRRMVKTAEPGFSVDYENARESLRNACTEVTSEDDSDICNLGSINLARIENPAEMVDAVLYGTLFLIAGTVYSDLPYAKVDETRTKNRRLGLGVMGVHEWLVKRGKKYGEDDELGTWLEAYAWSEQVAKYWADQHGLSVPVKTRAIAPTGTIGIIAETTTGIEPIFCVAYKRRYLDGQNWKYQYVIDPTAKRLIDAGANPHEIEDAYSLAYDVERRVAFQAWVQQYVDHGISSTINLPYPITDEDELKWFGEMLYPYLPKLRGVTAYPDGSRGGQPLSVVPYEVAAAHEGVVFEEEQDRCAGGACGV